jgi:hypothetical protein
MTRQLRQSQIMAGANPISEERLPAGALRLPHVVARPDWGVLRHILQPDINLAIWQRDVPAPIATWLSGRLPDDLPAQSHDIDTDVSAACVADRISMAIPSRTPVQRAGVAALARDAGDLANVLTRMSGSRSVRLRLEWVTDQQCSHFHADRVLMRLLCTYRGRATEWIANDVAERLGSRESVPPPAAINRLGTGDVAIMRGSLGNAAGAPMRHRSPPVDAPAEWRLLLAMDPVAAD